MCQTVGKCFVEDPFAKEKDAIWEARWFVEKHPKGSYEDLETHLKERGVTISVRTLREIVSNALCSLKQGKRSKVRRQEYKKILSLLPNE